MKKKVMITGVGGLIGSHLAEALLDQGCSVYGLDVSDIDKNKNLDIAKSNKDFFYFKGDIRNEEDIENFFQNDAAEIYHLASVVGVNRYMEDPLSLIDIGLIGTRNLIAKCEFNDVRMLFTSTSEVYGRNQNIPWSEDDDRVLGATSVDRWSYSTAKALCEHMLFGVHHSKDWPMTIVRFFNVYGPRQNPIYVVSKSIYNVLNGNAPELYDGGNQTRCFTYVEDVVQGIISAGTRQESIGEVINLGNPVENTMKEAIDIILEVSNSSLQPQEINTQERYGNLYEDIPRRVPSVKKAKDLLGWEPSTSLKEGIEKTIRWVENNPWYLR
ncbi:MAG: GDP-mannose 4,6-dehydratase [Gammaproteobacteria bacterium]|jgi:nucleoside-diphosphate-sugar epimerase